MKYAVVFPGQGSQAVGMLAELSESFEIVQETFAEASAVLGYDAWELAQHNPEDKLNQTQYTQPLMLTADIAVWRVLQQRYSMAPAFFAGHSLGEYAALVAAEVLTFTEAVKLVQLRGQYMSEAVSKGEGAMAAIVGLDDDKLQTLCEEVSGQVAPANFNSIGQTVISGETNAVNKVVELAKPAGAKVATLIPVSVPAHSVLMTSAKEKLAVAMAEATFSAPRIPVIHNFDVEMHNDSATIKTVLLEQLVGPVRWVETVQKMVNVGVDLLIEVGPGKVLTGLAKRIDRSLDLISVNSTEGVDALAEKLS